MFHLHRSQEICSHLVGGAVEADMYRSQAIEKVGVHIESGCIHLRIDVIKVSYLQNGEFCGYMLLEDVLTMSLLITAFHPLLPILTVWQFDLEMSSHSF